MSLVTALFAMYGVVTDLFERPIISCPFFVILYEPRLMSESIVISLMRDGKNVGRLLMRDQGRLPVILALLMLYCFVYQRISLL